MNKFDIERFNLKKINMVEGKEQCQVKISNRFAALVNLDDDVDINRAS
jgi:imidazoleglycerol phosphate dehydratase HisB